MTGIAITLATRQDAEAVAGIEKLTGQKISRAGKAAETQTAPEKSEERRAEPKREKAAPRRERTREPKRERVGEPRGERTQQPKHDPVPDSKSERLPVVEDISTDWNGPLPSFLSKSAG
jgi:type IV secretory pathway VirJ component